MELIYGRPPSHPENSASLSINDCLRLSYKDGNKLYLIAGNPIAKIGADLKPQIFGGEDFLSYLEREGKFDFDNFIQKVGETCDHADGYYFAEYEQDNAGYLGKDWNVACALLIYEDRVAEFISEDGGLLISNGNYFVKQFAAQGKKVAVYKKREPVTNANDCFSTSVFENHKINKLKRREDNRKQKLARRMNRKK